MHALHRLSTADWLALFAFIACWAGYAWFSEHSRWASAGLIRSTRLPARMGLPHARAREVRVTDSTLIGNLVTSVTFYANTTIYIIAGLVAALGAADKLLTFTADLAFGGAGNRELLEIKLMLVLASFVYAYFKFTWSLRQFNVLSILVGAAPLGQRDEPAIESYARRVAAANNLAGDDFNRGIRAYYFGLAASGWLLSPLSLAVLSVLILVVLYRRDYRSAVLDVLRETH
jgi:uncharacterized membrane protein